jgi:hypothetical protein
MREQEQHQKLNQRESTLSRDLENDQTAEQDSQRLHIYLKVSEKSKPLLNLNLQHIFEKTSSNVL